MLLKNGQLYGLAHQVGEGAQVLGSSCGLGLYMPYEQREVVSERHTDGQEQRGFGTGNQLVRIQPKN